MRRRQFVKAGAALGTSALGFPFIRAARAQLNVDRSQLTKTLRFTSYGGSWQQALSDAAIKPFEAKYGVQVIQESHASEAALIAKMKASGPGSYDIATVNEISGGVCAATIKGRTISSAAAPTTRRLCIQ